MRGCSHFAHLGLPPLVPLHQLVQRPGQQSHLPALTYGASATAAGRSRKRGRQYSRDELDKLLDDFSDEQEDGSDDGV